MKIDDISKDYGINVNNAFKFCNADRVELLRKVRKFIREYSDIVYIHSILLDANEVYVINYIEKLKSDSMYIGAYMLHLECANAIKERYVSVETASNIKYLVQKALEYWNMYLPSRYSTFKDKFSEFLLELEIALNFNLELNINYLIDRLYEECNTTEKRILYKKILFYYNTKDYKGMYAFIESECCKIKNINN